MVNKLFLKSLTAAVVIISISSCKSDTQSENSQTEDTMVTESSIDYESPSLLAKFDTKDMTWPDSISYYDEIKKLDDAKAIHYSALDSLYASGVHVSETLYYESSGGGWGIGFKFTFKGGFSKNSGYASPTAEQTTAIEMALKAYDHAVTFDDAFDPHAIDRAFDLNHFLLSRGADPNKEALLPLFNCLKSLSNKFEREEEHLRRLIGLYKFYGLDMKLIDISACNNEEPMMHFLIEEGARTYDMNTFSFESDVKMVYDQFEELKKKGVVFDFSKVDGFTFSFASDTTSLKMFLEMGMSPHHITPEGITLREDFGVFAKDELISVLDRFEKEH